jgi:predicted phage terminase large subunit-like protein
MDQHLAETWLIHFLRQAWPILEPVTPLVEGWHLEAICDHWQAVLNGHIRRLIINVPPRCTKSITSSVMVNAFAWIDQPALRFLGVSYAEKLSIRDALKTRTLIQSDWYQERWADKYQLSEDQNQKTRFENDKTGHRIATSIHGTGTGEGGDIITVDDPHNIKDGESDAKRESVIQYTDEVMPSRLNNAKTGRIVLIMQRSHTRDMTGHLLAKNAGYEHLCLPMEYEENRVKTGLNFVDPRTEQGELLIPERYDTEEVKTLQVDLGSYAYNGQYQQRPAPREGGIIKVKWFRRYDQMPLLEKPALGPDEKPMLDDEGKVVMEPTGYLTLSLDTAYKPNQLNDPSVLEVWFEQESRHYLLEVWREKVGYPELKRSVKLIAEKWAKFINEVLIEDKASGQSLIQDLREDPEWPHPVIAMEPGQQDKIVRMENESAQVEAGNCWLPEKASWLFDFETEVGLFPKAANDDQVDSMSQYLKRQRDGRGPALVRFG